MDTETEQFRSLDPKGIDSVVSYWSAVALDGIVYMVPYFASHVLTIDTMDSDALDGFDITGLGLVQDNRNNQYNKRYSTAVAHGGKVFAAPWMALQVLVVMESARVCSCFSSEQVQQLHIYGVGS